jgi:hypothetical protein
MHDDVRAIDITGNWQADGQPAASIQTREPVVPAGARVTAAAHAGRAVPFECVESGDSRWVWVRDLGGQVGVVEIRFDEPGCAVAPPYSGRYVAR